MKIKPTTRAALALLLAALAFFPAPVAADDISDLENQAAELQAQLDAATQAMYDADINLANARAGADLVQSSYDMVKAADNYHRDAQAEAFRNNPGATADAAVNTMNEVDGYISNVMNNPLLENWRNQNPQAVQQMQQMTDQLSALRSSRDPTRLDPDPMGRDLKIAQDAYALMGKAWGLVKGGLGDLDNKHKELSHQAQSQSEKLLTLQHDLDKVKKQLANRRAAAAFAAAMGASKFTKTFDIPDWVENWDWDAPPPLGDLQCGGGD